MRFQIIRQKKHAKKHAAEMGGQICYSATVATVKFTPFLSSKIYLYLYIYLYIYKYKIDFRFSLGDF